MPPVSGGSPAIGQRAARARTVARSTSGRVAAGGDPAGRLAQPVAGRRAR